MILNNAVNAGSFVYCMAYFTPNEENTYFNSGNGHYHQFAYIVEGSGTAEIRNIPNGEVVEFNDTNQPGALVDLSHSKDQYHTTKTSNSNLAMMLFNPIPDTRQLTVEIVKGPASRSISATDNRIVIVCITGDITANNKVLNSMQHAKLFPGKTAELVLPANTICALVSE